MRKPPTGEHWRAVCGRTACTVRRAGRREPSRPLSGCVQLELGHDQRHRCGCLHDPHSSQRHTVSGRRAEPERAAAVSARGLDRRENLKRQTQAASRSPRRKIPTPGRVLFLLTVAGSCASGVVLPAATLQGLVQRRAGPWSGQRVMLPITAHRSVRLGSTGADALSARWRIRSCRVG